MNEIEGWVWCDHVGAVHEHVADPYDMGPQPKANINIDDDEWHEGVGGIWHYMCPGPHHKLWKGKETE